MNHHIGRLHQGSHLLPFLEVQLVGALTGYEGDHLVAVPDVQRDLRRRLPLDDPGD